MGTFDFYTFRLKSACSRFSQKVTLTTFLGTFTTFLGTFGLTPPPGEIAPNRSTTCLEASQPFWVHIELLYRYLKYIYIRAREANVPKKVVRTTCLNFTNRL